MAIERMDESGEIWMARGLTQESLLYDCWTVLGCEKFFRIRDPLMASGLQILQCVSFCPKLDGSSPGTHLLQAEHFIEMGIGSAEKAVVTKLFSQALAWTSLTISLDLQFAPYLKKVLWCCPRQKYI